MKLAKFHGQAEIFHTIQGEGISVGLPATFVRASLCNLHCQWCDTDYTWNFTGTPWKHDNDAKPGYEKHRKSDVIINLTPQEVAELVREHPPRRVVLTGGEPLLQQAAWLEMIHALREGNDESWVFEVETNGTLLPMPEFEEAVSQFNVSPKLENSGNAESLRKVPEVLNHFARSPKAWFKFVVTGPEDVEEIKQLIQQFSIPNERVLIMPEGRSGEELNRGVDELVQLCITNGWRYCDRLHIRLWGNKRGV